MRLDLIIMVAEAIVMLFQLRALMQTSSVDYYHRLTQVVVSLTEPVIKLLPFRNNNIKGFYYCGMLISLILSFIFWAVLLFTTDSSLNLTLLLLLPVLMTVKCFGYLLIGLMIVQALTSWLPSTRSLSYLLGQITYPVVSTVQRIIPPIGMIDISLMVVLLGLYLLNGLAYSIFGTLWLII